MSSHHLVMRDGEWTGFTSGDHSRPAASVTQAEAARAVRAEALAWLGLAQLLAIGEVQPMRTSFVILTFQILTWCCVALLGLLSLLPAQEMARTGLPGELEHFVAYAGSAAVAIAGYGMSRGVTRVITWFSAYAGALEYLQHFSPGRHPSIVDFAVSSLGALCGGLAVALLFGRRSSAPRP